MMMKNLVAVVFLSLLTACGFEPLYVQKQHDNPWFFGKEFDTSISQEMAQIKVEPIADRFGQQVRNNLLDLLTPKGAPKKPKYRLTAFLKRKTVTQQAMRTDITATSERVRYLVQYELYEGSEKLLTGTSVANVSYNILSNPYSTKIKQKKTETDAAKIIADDMALRIGAYFHMKISNKKGPADDL